MLKQYFPDNSMRRDSLFDTYSYIFLSVFVFHRICVKKSFEKCFFFHYIFRDLACYKIMGILVNMWIFLQYFNVEKM